jgi:hypothetical protein
MNPFGATLVLLLTARDAKRFAGESRAPRTLNPDCSANRVRCHRCSSMARRSGASCRSAWINSRLSPPKAITP